jgi:hypothetical protein
MDKTLEATLVEATLLMDFYGELLTEKQRDVYTAYFLDDLTLAEIAEQQSVSRQAVHDIIKRTHKTLIKYEEKLKLIETHQP